MSRKRIICHVNRVGWCHYTTAQSIMDRLSDEFKFDLITGRRPNKRIRRYSLLWGRGPVAFNNEGERNDNMGAWIKHLEAAGRFICSLTMGNEELARLVEKHKGLDKPIGFIAQNHQGAEMGKQITEKTWFIPHGVETRRFTPETPFALGYAGRCQKAEIRYRKGVDIAKQACQLLQIPFRIASSKGANNINHENMPDFYRSLSAYWGGSLAEGSSNSIMEAMATALPCIVTTGVGYHGEVCKDAREHQGGEVLFISKERTLEEVRDALIYLRDNPEERKRIGQNARKFAEAHDWDIAAEAYRQMFREAIAIAEQNAGNGTTEGEEE